MDAAVRPVIFLKLSLLSLRCRNWQEENTGCVKIGDHSGGLLDLLTIVTGGQLYPLAGIVVPGTGNLAVGGLVHQRHPTDAYNIDVPLYATNLIVSGYVSLVRPKAASV